MMLQQIADELALMRQSLEAMSRLPEYKSRSADLASFQQRLEVPTTIIIIVFT
jgi:hypothetical protein